MTLIPFMRLCPPDLFTSQRPLPAKYQHVRDSMHEFGEDTSFQSIARTSCGMKTLEMGIVFQPLRINFVLVGHRRILWVRKYCEDREYRK